MPSPLPSVRRIDVIANVLLKVTPRLLAPRIEQARRDALMVVRGFAGSHPSPVIARKRAPEAVAPVTLVRSVEAERTSDALGVVHHMEIVAITRESKDAVTLTLADVRGERVAFRAGQFMLLRVDVAGESLWRAYSICTAPSDERIAVTIKRVENGRVSNDLNDRAAVGHVLEVRGPSGRFTLENACEPRHLIMLAGGSGITPLMSHVRHWLATEPNTRITLLYGSRREQDILFRAALDALSFAHEERLVVRHILDQTGEGGFGQGPLDEVAVARELDRLEFRNEASTHYLVCGPAPMMQACRAVLSARGVDDDHVLEERFFGLATRPESTSFRAEDVTLTLASGEHKTRVSAGQTILQAALRDGLALDSSCAMGGCGACMAVLVEGSVHMPEPNCLTKRERKAGKILTCIAQPRSACRVEKLR